MLGQVINAPVTREMLYEAVWAEPMGPASKRFKLSERGLKKVCIRYDVPIPPFGYWAKKRVGKEPAPLMLPPNDDPDRQVVEFRNVKNRKAALKAERAADRASDEEIKRLILAEALPENQIVVPRSLSFPHPAVLAAQAVIDSWKPAGYGRFSPRGLDVPSSLGISVAEPTIPRALRIMNAFIRAAEKRGSALVTESSNTLECEFNILGERIGFQLREATARVPVQGSPDRWRYRSTGELLMFMDGCTRFADRQLAKVEDQLNLIMVAALLEVDRLRQHRKQHAEVERLRRQEDEERERGAEEQRQEAARCDELDGLIGDRDKAAKIRQFVADYRGSVERTHGPIEDRSELALWLQWALRRADAIDPLCRAEPIRRLR